MCPLDYKYRICKYSQHDRTRTPIVLCVHCRYHIIIIIICGVRLRFISYLLHAATGCSLVRKFTFAKRHTLRNMHIIILRTWLLCWSFKLVRMNYFHCYDNMHYSVIFIKRDNIVRTPISPVWLLADKKCARDIVKYLSATTQYDTIIKPIWSEGT